MRCRNSCRPLAEQAQRNPNVAQIPPNAAIQELRSQDLERMLDQIENLSKTGAKDAARQLLSQLQNMLENLQAGQPQQGGDQGQQQAMENLNQLGDMIRKQEELMNQTFRAQRGQSPDGKPMTPEELQQALKDLQAQQQALGDQLQKLMEQMLGPGPRPPAASSARPASRWAAPADALGNGRPAAPSASRARRSTRYARGRRASPSNWRNSRVRVGKAAVACARATTISRIPIRSGGHAARPAPTSRLDRQGSRRDRYPTRPRDPRRDSPEARRCLPARAGGATTSNACSSPSRRLLLDDTDVRQLAERVGHIHAVADDEKIGTTKPTCSAFIGCASLPGFSSSTATPTRRAPRFIISFLANRQRPSGFQDVVDQQHIAPAHVAFHVARQRHLAGRNGAGFVARTGK